VHHLGIYLGIWAFGHLGIWAFGHLGIWAFGHLGLGAWPGGPFLSNGELSVLSAHSKQAWPGLAYLRLARWRGDVGCDRIKLSLTHSLL
jgi:hypothetical protein